MKSRVTILFVCVMVITIGFSYTCRAEETNSQDEEFPVYAVVELDWHRIKQDIIELKTFFKDKEIYHLDFTILSYAETKWGWIDSRYCKYDPQPCLKHFERVENMRINSQDTVRAFICREVNSTKYHYVFWNKNDTIVYQEPSTYVLDDKEYPTASITDSYPFKLLSADIFQYDYFPYEYMGTPISTTCFGFRFIFSSGKIKEIRAIHCVDLTVPREIKKEYKDKIR